MLEEQAQVMRVDGEFAWVETQRQSACGACSANKVCGSAVLAKVLGSKRSRVRALNRIDARLGDVVIIGLQEQALVTGSLAVYAVPLFGLIGGAVFSEFMAIRLELAAVEAVTIFGGVVGLLFGTLWLRRFARSIKADARYHPVILRKVGLPADVKTQPMVPVNQI